MNATHQWSSPSVLVVCASAPTPPAWAAPLEAAGLVCQVVAPAELAARLGERRPNLLVAALDDALTGAAGAVRALRHADPVAGLAPLVGLAPGGASPGAELEEAVDAWLDPTSSDWAQRAAALASAARRPLEAARSLGARLEAEAWSTEQIEYLVHDLKNPLGTILTNLRLLRPRLGTEPASHRLVGDAEAAARRLEHMVLNLLDVGRLSAGQLTLELISVPLEDLVEEAVAAVRPTATARAVTLEESLGPPATTLVRVDFDLMTRVLVNLLENAIRHSPSGAAVRLATERRGGDLRLTISDRGAGVPEPWRTRIFERFVQRGPGGPGRVGRGLGLAFSRLVAEAHGVVIGVEPGEPTGSRFYVGLPVT